MNRTRRDRVFVYTVCLLAILLTLWAGGVSITIGNVAPGSARTPGPTARPLIPPLTEIPILGPLLAPAPSVPTPWFVPNEPPLLPSKPPPGLTPPIEKQGDNYMWMQVRTEAKTNLYLTACDGTNERRRQFALDFEWYFPQNNHWIRSYGHPWTDECGTILLYFFPASLTTGQTAYISVKSEGNLVKYISFVWQPNGYYELYPARAGDSETAGINWNKVDVSDFNSLRAAFGHCAGIGGSYTRRNDFNYDLCVDVADFQHIHMNFGTSGDPTVCMVHPCSPEPPPMEVTAWQ